MKTVLLAMAMIGQYDLATPDGQYFLIGDAVNEKSAELPDAAADDRPLLVVYSDHECRECLDHLRKDTDSLTNFRVDHRDESRRPEQLSHRGLPLAHWQHAGRWYATEYTSASSFLDRDYEIDHPRRTVKQSSVPVQKLPVPSMRLRYQAKSYDWHMVNGENAATLRQHLSRPSAEHHGHSFDPGWLSQLTYTELVGLHSDAHNNRVQWQYVKRAASVQPVVRQQTIASTYCPTCPTRQRRW